MDGGWDSGLPMQEPTQTRTPGASTGDTRFADFRAVYGSGLGKTQDSVQALVDELAKTFREQVKRALGVELDHSATSLAFVDHYLRLARDEDRAPIVALLAAGAGAYFGELIRRDIGAIWVGAGSDPRRLRLLLTPQFIHFCPVDQALEAIANRPLTDEDPRVPDGPAFDPVFHLRPPKRDDADEVDERDPLEPEDDATWLEARLADLAPVSEDHFYSLTCRYETLGLMLELLAAKHAGEGKSPRELAVADYVEALSGA